MRVFAGLLLSQPVMDRLALLRLRLAGPRDGLRWSTPEQWHITLRFFGEIADAAVPELVDAVAQLKTSTLQLRIEQLGSFATKGILFAEVIHTPELFELQAQVESVALRNGHSPESRPFHPHVTLARSRNRTGLATMARLTTPEAPPFGPRLSWEADRLWIYETVLKAGGAQYQTLANLPLR